MYYAMNPVRDDKQTIVIDDDMVSRIGSLFQKQWGRLPTDAEWTALLDNEIREEVYYRQESRFRTSRYAGGRFSESPPRLDFHAFL